MRSRTCCSISSGEVHQWALDCLLQAKLVRDRGWKCTAIVVLNILLRAAARSISAACRDLASAPSDQAVMTALEEGLPKTLSVLERRLNEALTGELPRGASPGLRPRFARVTGSGSASKPAFANCARRGFTPARANLACGCYSSRWRWCSATCGSGSTTCSWPKATETTARSISNASASNACWTGSFMKYNAYCMTAQHLTPPATPKREFGTTE